MSGWDINFARMMEFIYNIEKISVVYILAGVKLGWHFSV